MKLLYKDKTIELFECKSFFSRFMGFMGKKNFDYALFFNHCNSIHTFFMRENIDVILCDKNNKVLYYYKDLGPNKVILPKKGVRLIFELPANSFDVRINDRLEIVK